MKLKKILLYIPFLVAIATIIRCWIEIAVSGLVIRWQHETAIVFAIITIYFCFKSFNHAVYAIGVFLILGTCNAFSMTASVEWRYFGIGGLTTPPFNGLSLGLLFLYFVLNFDTLTHLYLDNKEKKAALKKQRLKDKS